MKNNNTKTNETPTNEPKANELELIALYGFRFSDFVNLAEKMVAEMENAKNDNNKQ